MEEARRRALAVVAALACVAAARAPAWSEEHHVGPRIVGTWEIEGEALAAGQRTVPLGGISDLHFTAAAAGRPAALWAVTDRGPNAVARAPQPGTKGKAGKLRALLEPDFQPALVRLDASCLDMPVASPRGTMAVRQVVPLVGRSGRPVSGRPNGIGRDEPAHAADGLARLPPDPDGVDTEGVVAVGDEGFWLVEEYRPSILRVAADGRLVARYVPEGEAIPGACTDVVDCLPAHFSRRADNRGFEAVAITPDASRLYVLLQSPLARTDDETAGAVPLLEFDPAVGRPGTEHRYLLDTADADGKLCAMACLGNDTLLVLEQADGDVKRLYRVDLDGNPVRKSLVADLGSLLPAMRADVYGDRDARSASAARGPLKIEGLAVIDSRHVLLANDNDFGVSDSAAERGVEPRGTPRNCLWLIELPAALHSDPPT